MIVVTTEITLASAVEAGSRSGRRTGAGWAGRGASPAGSTVSAIAGSTARDQSSSEGAMSEAVAWRRDSR